MEKYDSKREVNNCDKLIEENTQLRIRLAEIQKENDKLKTDINYK